MKKIIITKSITNRDDEILNLYLKDINKIPILSEEEEISLYPMLKAKDKKVIDLIVKSNLRFVVTVAKKYQGQGLPLMDLISFGNMGLMKGAKQFDPDKGTKFLTYVGWWIKQSIVNGLNQNARMIRVPNSTLQNLNKILKIYNEYNLEFEREPSYEELMNVTGFSLDMITAALQSKTKCLSVDEPFEKHTEDAGSLLDIIPNGDYNAEEEFLNKETIQMLYKALDRIPIREATMLKMYYGLYAEPMNLDEIGFKFGITAERVRQIKDNALKIIKKVIKR